jgi:hypothetical protein
MTASLRLAISHKPLAMMDSFAEIINSKARSFWPQLLIANRKSLIGATGGSDSC